jgi:monoamine oxidase
LLNRREFLKGGTALAALAIPYPPALGALGMRTAILGAGVAGLAAAVQLRRHGLDFDLYEAGSRIGGRVWTQDNFNADGQFAELGGELIDSNHTTLISWARHFGLELESFEGRAQGKSEDLYYFGGQRYGAADLAAGLKPMAAQVALAIAELRDGIGDSQELGHWFHHNPGVLKYDRMTLAEFIDGLSGVDRWIKDVVSRAYTGEFGLDPQEQTAINLLELFDPEQADRLFGDSDETLRIHGGNGRLVQKMFERACPGGARDRRLHMEHELLAIRDLGRKIGLTFRTAGGLKTVAADRVICTIPFGVLRSVDGIGGLPLSPVKRRAILETGYGTNSKITLGFERRFWRDSAVSTSASIVTDLSSQSFWDSTRRQEGGRGILTDFLGGVEGARASEASVAAAIADLGEIFDGPSARDSFEKRVVTNWTAKPFQRGSYLCLRPGQLTRCWGSNHVPELNRRLMFAGEHTDLAMVGYMEGALRSGIRAAGQVRASVSF